MTKYEIFYRKKNDNRAPEKVNLDLDYRKVGVVIAENLRNVEQIIFSKPEVIQGSGTESRRMQVGDVIIQHWPTKQAFIYTATGHWAGVMLLKY